MNRRGFLQKLGIGAGAVVASPVLAKLPDVPVMENPCLDLPKQREHVGFSVKDSIIKWEHGSNLDKYPEASTVRFTTPVDGVYSFSYNNDIMVNGVNKDNKVYYDEPNITMERYASIYLDLRAGDIISSSSNTFNGYLLGSA